ncbi:phosphatase PAP2 family protein [Gordonia spumicola]|uniref:phosphatase PAP2 family protein n=1 Tax=Gordonia spumicola TaxID=589161 RepID=UPI001E40EFE2|nr:phosphatase PAP2 family protein [Gordonia spumicola]
MVDPSRPEFFERVRLLTRRRVELGVRGWSAVVASVVGFALVIEVAARLNSTRGPLDLIVHDFAGRPGVGEIKTAALILALVCMPARLRWRVLGGVAALEILWNLQRLAVGNTPIVGNGMLWGLVATGAYALWRLHGTEKASTLKAVGLGLMMIVVGRVGDVWLVLSMKASPLVLDHYVEMADRALGSPSWVVGRVVDDSTVLTEVLGRIYVYLPVGAAVIAYLQLRNSARDGFPRHHIIRTFLLIGAIGPIIYFLFPVVGPTYAFGSEVPGAGWLDVWPHAVPETTVPAAQFYDQSVPRNCMPSLHTAWAMAIFLHGWRGGTGSKVFGSVWLLATTGATLGFGFHYAVDVLAGIVFVLTLEAALTRPDMGWTRLRAGVIACGAVMFAALLLMTRYAAPWLAVGGALPVLLLLAPVVITVGGFLLVERPEKFRLPDFSDGPRIGGRLPQRVQV